jgi:hypothetical protein
MVPGSIFDDAISIINCVMVTKIDDYCSNKITFSKGRWQTPFGCMILAW